MQQTKIIDKLYVIDDDQIIHAILKYRLDDFSQVGEVKHFDQASEVISQIESSPTEEHPNIIILDLNMPKMDGFEFLDGLSQLKTLNPNTQVIILSSTNTTANRDRCMSYPVIQDYLEKPLKDVDIQSMISRYLETHS